MLAFVPLTPAGLAAWASGTPYAGPAFAATPAFLSAFGVASGDDEDADLTLLEIAALDGLLRHGVRLVAVVDAPATPAEPAEFGAVTLPASPWTRVESLFADDADGAAQAASVRDDLGVSDLATAWDAEATRPLLTDVELLWHGSTEWEHLSH